MFTTRSVRLNELLVPKLTERVWRFFGQIRMKSSDTIYNLLEPRGRNESLEVDRLVTRWPLRPQLHQIYYKRLVKKRFSKPLLDNSKSILYISNPLLDIRPHREIYSGGTCWSHAEATSLLQLTGSSLAGRSDHTSIKSTSGLQSRF